jgi:hypothetical protein
MMINFDPFFAMQTRNPLWWKKKLSESKKLTMRLFLLFGHSRIERPIVSRELRRKIVNEVGNKKQHYFIYSEN